MKKKIGQNTLISGLNKDKNDIFIQRNQNFEEYMSSLSYFGASDKSSHLAEHRLDSRVFSSRHLSASVPECVDSVH